MNTADPNALPPRLNRALSHPAVMVLVPILVAGVAIVVLHRLAADVGWSDVKADIADSSPGRLALALLFTGLSFVAISFYDVLASRSVAPDQVPVIIAALAGACGVAVSNMLGLSYLTGTAVRYRIYASLGLDLSRIAALLATAWAGFLLGFALIFGALLSLHPQGLSAVLPISAWAETAAGVAILAGLLGGYLWLATGRRRLALGGFGFDLPRLATALGLTAASVGDLLGAALTLHVLMPADLVPNFPFFFVVYVSAVALGILSHAPGGLGVFEATVIAGLGAGGRSDALAALLLYRLTYTVLPFALASLSLAGLWASFQRRTLASRASWVYRLIRPIIPAVASGVTLLAGTLLLVSGNLPADSARLGVLRDILPLSFIEASHLAGSIAGLLLIVIARGLYRKLYRAWVIAVVLMGIGLLASLARGLDWEEGLSMVATLGLLLMCRGAFYRVSGASVFRLNGGWIVSLLALLSAITWVGFFAHSHVAYRDDLWWSFALHGDASRFLRASLVAALLLAAISLHSVLTARASPPRGTAIPDAVRQLVARSPFAEDGIALTGDKLFLVADDGSACLAYADTGGSLIAKGDPIGEEGAGTGLIWQLREQADKAGKRCAFYAVSERYLPTYLDLGLSILKIGEVARVRLAGFTLNGSAKKDFRHARARAAREGYVFEIVPHSEIAGVLAELRAISDRWLGSKQVAEKGFSVGTFSEDYLRHCDHAVLRHGSGGPIVAFANLLQGAGRYELSVDLMRHDPQGPGFAMDALFGELMLWGAAQGFEWFCLGAAPLSGLENRQLASLWNRIGGLVYDYGEQIYHFEGLRSFKEKFDPEWSPSYLASPGGFAAARVLYEINVLVSRGVRGLMM